jgi:hypothetical protein
VRSTSNQEVDDEATAETQRLTHVQSTGIRERSRLIGEKELKGMNVFKRSRTLVAGLAAVFVIAGCTGGGEGSPAASEGGDGGDGGDGAYAIGVSNPSRATGGGRR